MAASIAFEKIRIDIPAEGGYEYIQVDYINAKVVDIPACSQSWVSIEKMTEGNVIIEGVPRKQVKYKITVAPTSYSRQTTIFFSCSDANGNQASSNNFTVYQGEPLTAKTSYIDLNATEYTFPATGGTYTVTAEYGNPQDGVGLATRVSSGSVYPIAWCKIEGQGATSTALKGTEKFTITMNENTFDEPRQCEIRFQYTSAFNELVTEYFTAKQLAPEVVEPTGPEVNAFVTRAKINADGTSDSPTNFNSVKVGYLGVAIYEPLVGADWIHLGQGQMVENSYYDYVIEHPLTFDKNTGGERTGTVTFRGNKINDGTYTSVLTITQYAADGSGGVEAYITSDITQLNFKWDGTPYTNGYVDVVWYGSFNNRSKTSSDWINVGDYELIGYTNNSSTYRFSIEVDKNNTDVERKGTIVFGGTTTNAEAVTYTINVIQGTETESDGTEQPEIPVEGDEYCGPIWKDIEYNFGGVEQVEYCVYLTHKERVGQTLIDVDTLLFKGRSCKRPSDDSNTILVNKICQNYMTVPFLKKEASAIGAGFGTFKLTSGDGSTTYKVYRFVNDWSYGEFNIGLLSHPILNDKTVYRNQLLPFSVFGANETVSVPYSIKYNGAADWTNMVSVKNGVTTEMFPFGTRGYNAKSFVINGTVYPVVDDCKVEYVLYYLNPWGGYDWFPIKGKVSERDEITQYSYIQNYNNQTWDFGKKRYLSEIKKHYTLNTHWLTEDESSRMWYLLQSNVVYLHNIAKNEIQPVIITNTSMDHKKRGLISSRISYAIEVELSQTRERL